MAELSYFWNNPGTGDSPAAPGYTSAMLHDGVFRMILNGTGNRGVLREWNNELEVTNGGGLNAAVDTGAAIAYGLHYENTTAATVALPNNSVVWVIARRSWAAQTIRLAQVAALVQNPGVTYDIPLAQVTTAGGAITLITDSRVWCEYTTDLHDDVVETAHIQANAVTTAKLENQTRRIVRSAGMMEPDATNPATFVSVTLNYYDCWRFQDAVTEVIWCSFRVPEDFTGANISIYFWTHPDGDTGAPVAVQWGWNAMIAAPSAVLAASAGTINIDYSSREWQVMYRDAICNLAVNSGDIVHMEIMRNGGAAADTMTDDALWHALEATYTADS